VFEVFGFLKCMFRRARRFGTLLWNIHFFFLTTVGVSATGPLEEPSAASASP
jgi:hypothetical protein